MIFIVYAESKKHTIAACLGAADYSYYFVLKQFKPLLQKHGVVFEVGKIHPYVDMIYKLAKALGQRCLFLSFTPPHKTSGDLSCPTIPVFAWEYSTIPNESWGGDEKNNWAAELPKYPAAITHSRYTCEVVKQAVGACYPIVSIPAPVWDQFEKFYDPRAVSYFTDPVEIRIRGRVVEGADLKTLSMVCTAPEKVYDLKLSGVVYTAVFNPNDGRKNWPALVQAFCWAFKTVADATLVLKLTHADPVFSLQIVASELVKLMPFECRVLLIHGYLGDGEYKSLIQASSYVVNSAYGEGQCLPLMEFMSAGRPAIAPDHSGLSDYIRPANSFVVDSSLDWTNWPHDPRVLLRTFRRRVDWGGLHDCYLASYKEAKHQPENYRKRSARAREDLQNHCSRQIASEQLQDVIAMCAQRCSDACAPGTGKLAGRSCAAVWYVTGRIGLPGLLAVINAITVLHASISSGFYRFVQRLGGLPVIAGILTRVIRKLKSYAR